MLKIKFICLHFVVSCLFFQITPARYVLYSWKLTCFITWTIIFDTPFLKCLSWVLQSSTKGLILATTVFWSNVFTSIIQFVKVFFRLNERSEVIPILKKTSKEENYRPVNHYQKCHFLEINYKQINNYMGNELWLSKVFFESLMEHNTLITILEKWKNSSHKGTLIQ